MHNLEKNKLLLENEYSFNNRIFELKIMNQADDKTENLPTGNDYTKLGKLVRDTLQEVDDLFPPKSESVFETSIAKIYISKNKIQKIDPDWKFDSSSTLYVFEILRLLDALDTKEIPDLQHNAKVCQRLFYRNRLMTQINPSWKLDIDSIRNFLYPALKNVEKPDDSSKEENQSKEDLGNS